MKIDQDNLHCEPPVWAEVKGYLVKHYHLVDGRKLCMVKDVFDTLPEAEEQLQNYLDPSYCERDEPGVYICEILEWMGSDDEGWDLVGEEIKKVKYKIEHTVKVTEL